MKLTTKQKQIMAVVISGNQECHGVLEKFLNVSEIVERVPYTTTRDSMMFSIRALEKKGLISKGKREQRNSRWVTPIIPTEMGLELQSALRTVDGVADFSESMDIVMEGFGS